MQFIEIKDKEKWNSWISAQPFSQFLQSWEWGEFHKKMGRKVWRLAIYANQPQSFDGARRECESEVMLKGETIVLAAQVVKYNLPFRRSYLYLPRGPAASQKSITHQARDESQKLWNLFFLKIKKLAKEEKSIFLRIEPAVINSKFPPDANPPFEYSIKAKFNKVKSVQPENEWLLDLSQSEDELLKKMHQKTRYNIKLAEKKGVKIRMAEGKNDFDEFWRLISSTYSRKDIRAHRKEYYNGILEIGGVNAETRHCRVSTDAQTKLWVAEFEGKIIAANIVSYFGDAATYMHGGADYNYRSLMSPYLLQWEIIKDAKMRRYKFYNFGGVSGQASLPQKRGGISWTGITKFKKGFGGFELNYLGTYEASVRKWLYKGYRFVKIIRTVS